MEGLHILSHPCERSIIHATTRLSLLDLVVQEEIIKHKPTETVVKLMGRISSLNFIPRRAFWRENLADSGCCGFDAAVQVHQQMDLSRNGPPS